MKVKTLILVAIIAAISCGCSSSIKIHQKDIIDIIHSQKYEAVAEKVEKDKTEIYLYYRGWNDSADNIAHHILQR
tara:strand:- start:938 stop:1162 length:225 start_codon:yes stop_codon:yes gene_type:complete